MKNVPGLDSYYGDPPDDDEDGPCDMCAFTDTHCGECEDCCASVEDHQEVHPDPEPDCYKCLLGGLTRASLRVVELENRIRAVRDMLTGDDVWWLDVGEHAGGDTPLLPFVEVADVWKALDGES